MFASTQPCTKDYSRHLRNPILYTTGAAIKNDTLDNFNLDKYTPCGNIK